MFCENCGSEMENAKFCPICGAEQRSVVISTSAPAASAPIEPEASSIPITPAPEASIPAASAPAAPAPEASSIPAAPSTPVAPEAASIPTAPSAPIAPAAQPAPAPIPAPITVVPAGVSSSPTVIVENDKQNPKRKYTGGHIALCLITAAIMAGIAGMFAGLYFSLLWSIR